ncbi:hypothetical protein TNCV_1858571 [Trichonephila clavipes]|nr:hypothetical protein TNCV_1858571 [Trichonephila clavipes]
MKLNIEGFHINRLDRPTRGWCSLALLIRDVKYQNIVIPQTSMDLEIQSVSISWGKHKLSIFNMYHPQNQGCLPDFFLDLAAANVLSIFIGDLNAKHTSCGCSVNNSRGCDLLNAADDRALLFLNDGFQHTTPLATILQKALILLLLVRMFFLSAAGPSWAT